MFIVLACVIVSCRADPRGRSRAKVVEDYVLSADFDSGTYPQLRHSNAPTRPWRDHAGEEFPPEPEIYREGTIDRDLIVHGHHPPPPPAAVVSPYSLFAIGFIGFLTLIGTLQASLALMTTTSKTGGLLGGLGGNRPGRRKRSVPRRS